MNAAADEINASGGINGHVLKVSICHDQANTNQAQACGQQAVANSNVVAIVGQDSYTGGPLIDPMFEKAGLADVGLEPITKNDFSCAVCFPLGGGPLSEVLVTPTVLNQQSGAKHIAIVTAPIAAAQQLVKATSANFAAKVPGGSIDGVYIPNGTTDYSPYIAKMQSAGVDGMYVFEASIFVGMVQTANQLGFHVPIAVNSQNITATEAKTLGSLVNNISITGVTTPPNANEPGTNQFRADMTKYAAGQPADTLALQAWVAVKMFAAGAEATPGDVTRASVLQGMKGMKNWDSGGIIPPYSTDQPWAGLGGSAPRVFDPAVIVTKSDTQGVQTAVGGFVSP